MNIAFFFKEKSVSHSFQHILEVFLKKRSLRTFQKKGEWSVETKGESAENSDPF